MPESDPASVEVRGVTKRYGAVEALRGISFSVRGGEIFGLLGRNGAGKTTCLECVLGLRRPDAGSVTVDGIDALAAPEEAKAVIGAQLQASALPDHITPLEALRFAASFYRAPLPVEDLLERFSLREKAGAKFASLSGGQRQRLFLALAFVHRPRVVVLDEPTAGLDPAARRELHATIRELRATGATVVFSTHVIDEAEQLCDRVAIVEQGRIVAIGSPAELTGRARSTPRVAFRTTSPVDVAALVSDAAIHACREIEGEWLAEAADVNAAIVAIVRHVAASGNQLVDLRVQRPTLEDVFVELTGTAWAKENAR